MPTKEFFKISEFESNIRASFSELRKEEDMIDVTLATDDGTLIDAHKMILSAGSNFFGQLFRHQSKHRMHLKSFFKVVQQLVKILTGNSGT